MKNISIFGGSITQPGEKDYQQAVLLGQLLSQNSYTIMTGGYIGVMEAVSRGAAEIGGRVIGYTCDEIENWRSIQPNSWVQEERRQKTIRQRLFALIEDCDAALALPGGPGTLNEIAMMWTLVLTGVISPRPLILIGSGWKSTFQDFYKNFDTYIPLEQRELLSFAPDIISSISMLCQIDEQNKSG